MNTENDPLIQGNGNDPQHNDSRVLRNRVFIWSTLVVIFILVVVTALVDPAFMSNLGLSGKLPSDPQLAAQRLLSIAPVIVCLLHIFCLSNTDRIHRMGILVCSASMARTMLLHHALRSSFGCSLWLAQQCHRSSSRYPNAYACGYSASEGRESRRLLLVYRLFLCSHTY